MKKSFMTRVLAVSLSAAMAFSMSSASNLMTASAASTVNLHTTFKTLKVNQTYKMVLKNNTLNWKITKVTTTNKAICTVYGKTASSVMLKGKGVGRAKITVKVKTTKRKYPKNIKNMKCTVNVKAATNTGTEDVAFSATAAANSNTEVRVNFTQAVDAAAVENFKITEENVSVSKAELSDDKKSVLLTIAGAEYSKNYELTVTGIKVGGTVQADQKLTFTTPSPEVTNPVSLTAERAILKSDGQDATTITFKITDAQGNPLTDKGMEVRFTTNLGKFATDRVSIQNGEAKVMYTSEALSENHTAMITATIIEAPADTKLIGTYASTSISLMPNPDQLDDTSIGATLTSITAPTADRIYAYFNKEVNAEDFKVGDKPNTKKFDATIKSGLDNGYGEGSTVVEHDIVGILPVENDKTALQLLVNKPMVDNSIIKVEFENKTQTNGIYIPKNTAYCKLTDARQPAVVSINPIDQRTIEIEFSEAVLPKNKCDKEGNGISEGEVARQIALTADNLENYQIDGVQLSNENYWGTIKVVPTNEEVTSGSSSNNTLKKLSEKDPSDDNTDENGEIKVGTYGKRNVVTIKLSRERYLEAGRTHRISIANVGDWAAKTDKERNIVSTEGFDFEVEADNSTPTFTATAMSPEQYLLEFNTDIMPVSKGDRIRTSNSALFASVIKLEERSGNGAWTEISNSDSGSGKNHLRITRVKEDGTLTNKYLVEVQRDWTDVYNTSGTRDNYYRHSYRLTIDAEKILNPVNGNRNAALSVELTDDVMKTADSTSPAIEKIDEAEGNIGSYNVFMTEPVKLSSNANIEGLTPSQSQQGGNGAVGNMGVPTPEAQFVHVEDGRTVEGIIESNEFVDAYDQIINVAPETELGNGEWDLIVRSISDDIGNTAATLTKRISVDNPVTETNFRVVWAAVGYDPGAYTSGTATSYGKAIADANSNGNEGNCIYVKFNKPVTLFGSSTNAQSISNYTLNGSPLPTGTEIRAHINGYDDEVGLGTGVTDSITIVLPRDRFSGSGNSGIYTVSNLNTMLNISKTVTCSTTNEMLDNGGMIRIPFQFGSATKLDTGDLEASKVNQGSIHVVTPISSLNTTTDAVWGNSAKEQFDADGMKTEQDYYEKLKAALEDEKYRKVILTHSINLNSDAAKNVFGRNNTLTINRAVDLDLNGYNIDGNVVVSTDNSADSMYIFSSGGQSKITGTSKAVLTVNAGRIAEFHIQKVTVERSSTSKEPVILLNDVWVNSFVVDKGARVVGDIQSVDSNGFGLEFDKESTFIGKISINGSGVTNLKGDFVGKEVTVYQKAEIRLDRATIGEGTVISALSSGSKISLRDEKSNFEVTIDQNGEKPQIIAGAKDIEVYLGNTATSVIDFKAHPGCGFVTVDSDGKKESNNRLSDNVVADTYEATKLKKVDILPAGMPTVGSGYDDNGNVVITTGAISSSGLQLTALEERIKSQLKDSSDDEAKVAFDLSSSNLVSLSNNVITVNSNINNVTRNDELIVSLTYNGQSYKRTITIKKD
ncbi:MAG: hypothetical protein K2N87_05740 [Eubacterium sp.]|nr:hypothetical protein [Eubacterium sp.]